MPEPRALRIGLTGGIGSGKSTVSRLLADRGAALVDADAVSRQTTAAGGAAVAEIREQFGAGFVGADGAMDRDSMRALVFGDAGARQRLEAIVHPLVAAEFARQVAAAESAGIRTIVFDIPLLVESSRWRSQLDRVLVVDCSEATQISRVSARNGWTPQAVEKIIAGQATRVMRRAAADACIHNDGLSLPALALLVEQFSQRFGL